MKELSKEEFEYQVEEAHREALKDLDRGRAMKRAKKIFKPITKNISIAFRIYQEVLAENKERELQLDIAKHGAWLRKQYDYVADRPTCPKCGMPLWLIEVNTNKSNQVGGNYKTFWVCRGATVVVDDHGKTALDENGNVLHEKCLWESDLSENSMEDWMMVHARNKHELSQEEKIRIKRLKLVDHLMPNCPECGHHPLRLYAAVMGKDGVRNDWRSCFVCDKCHYQAFSRRTYGAQMKILLKENENDGNK